MLTIVANGTKREVADGITVADYLAALGLPPGQVVVEHNRQPLHRDRFAVTRLQSGDVLEVAQMVGGG